MSASIIMRDELPLTTAEIVELLQYGKVNQEIIDLILGKERKEEGFDENEC